MIAGKMGSSLEGKVALVTGGTAGIGFHTAVGLTERGARVFVTARDKERGQQAVLAIRQQARHSQVELLIADGSSVQATLALADQMSKLEPHLDILVNNVGGTFATRRDTIEGLEFTLALNFVGPFALTAHLLPLLARGNSGRIVNVVSSAFSMWKGDPFEDQNATRRYVGIEAYARAKLLNLLFVLSLARRLERSSTVANAVNPGMAWTPGTASLTPEAVPQWRFVWPIVRWVQRRSSAAAAAAAPVHVASSPDLARVSGRYFDGMREKRLPPAVLDLATQERAWELGERLVKQAMSARRSGEGSMAAPSQGATLGK
jgi:NAD(P)-dependent dehydrogenase (short-subunit alcohol dehydrogenase family)